MFRFNIELFSEATVKRFTTSILKREKVQIKSEDVSMCGS